jgi:ubiquinone/menaquinone biosynthesis C-methylase UbiE|tara:strand:- start:831 stop:1484 length:654 start_codon:yes stop_codon:yes gene_type:complete
VKALFYKQYNTSLYDEAYFQRTQERTETPGFSKEMELIIDLLQINNFDSVLDVGCGTGSSIKYILSKFNNIKIVGVEPSFLSLKKYCLGKYAVFNAFSDNLPFKSNTFTKVYLSHVIGHIENVNASLTEIRRVMKGGGKIVILTPRLFYRRIVYFKNIFDNFKPDPTILQYYSKSKLLKHLSSTGFQEEKTFAFDFYPNSYIERIIKKRLIGVFKAI